MKEIYDYACKKNKTIIAISDMYLSKNILIEILNKNGYTKFDDIFVSSEYNGNKESKILFEIAIKKLKISKESVIHIGDNIYSDIKKAREFGINAFYVPSVMSSLFKSNPEIENFYKNHINDIGASIMLGLLAYHSEDYYTNYWYEIGYRYAGPVIFGYMQWLSYQLKKDEMQKVLFVGRDGYTLDKVFKLINNEVISHYFNLPRKIAKDIFDEDPKISESTKKEYMIYLEQFDIKENKIGLVDSITYFFFISKSISFSFSRKIYKRILLVY